MRALIDSDILCYEMGSAKAEDGYPLPWNLVVARVDKRIEQIVRATEADYWNLYLTGKDNFRDKIATIQPYKGTRDRNNRPFWYLGIYNYLRDDRNAIVIDGAEADDGLTIEHANSDGHTILCSRDKDLMQVPGWHYTWPSWKQEEQQPHIIGELDGLRFFYGQLLTGDRSDNIPGLYNVGPKSASVNRIWNETDSELSCFKEVKQQYKLRFGSYWDMFMCENGRLLWMKRSEDDDWYIRQKELECRSKDEKKVSK